MKTNHTSSEKWTHLAHQYLNNKQNLKIFTLRLFYSILTYY